MLFVDREAELKALESEYELCRKGVRCGVLVYGWRRVGKTSLVKYFLKNMGGGIYINCAWLSNTMSLASKVRESIAEFDETLSNIFWGKISSIEDPEQILYEALETMDSLAKKMEKTKLIIVLDEFHVFLENIAKKIARIKRENINTVKERVFWFFKDLLERKNAFWILLSSIGWEKLEELMFLRRGGKQPLLATFRRIPIKPLDMEASMELAMKIREGIPLDAARTIAEISGGIPPIIITLASSYDGASVIRLAYRLMEKREFDDFFINIIKLVSELSRRDLPAYIQVLLALARDIKSPTEISRSTGLDEAAVSEILRELTKNEILTKKREKGRVLYEFRYPLMKFWLKTSEEFLHEITMRDVSSLLGISAESYIRELLAETIGKEITIWDNKLGTFLAGTAKELTLKITKVFSRKETEKALRGIENADIIAEETNKVLIIEVKATTKPITRDTIAKLAKVISQYPAKKRKQGILIQLGTGKISPPAVAEATRNNIVIITREGIRLIAKKANFPEP